MILSCDPPRHALLVHFGTRRPSGSIHTQEFEYRGATVEIAVNPETVPPTLVAIHFVRHGFRLPFVHVTDEDELESIESFHLQSGRLEKRYFFNFAHKPQNCLEWQAGPGLTVILSEPPRTASELPHDIENRPCLYGLLVDLEMLQVEVDMNEFVFEFGSDSLKDVPVTLFVHY